MSSTSTEKAHDGTIIECERVAAVASLFCKTPPRNRVECCSDSHYRDHRHCFSERGAARQRSGGGRCSGTDHRDQSHSSLQLPSFADLVDRVKPAVVSVYVKEGAEQTLVSNLPNGESQNPFGPGSPFQFFFHQFGMPQPDGPGMQNGPGLQGEPPPSERKARGSSFRPTGTC